MIKKCKNDYTIMISGHRVDLRRADNYNFTALVMDKEDTCIIYEYTHWNMIIIHKSVESFLETHIEK